MEEAKKGFLPMSHGIYLSKTRCPSTTDERECDTLKIPSLKITYQLLISLKDLKFKLQFKIEL
jgi:hypothetical protein